MILSSFITTGAYNSPSISSSSTFDGLAFSAFTSSVFVITSLISAFASSVSVFTSSVSAFISSDSSSITSSFCSSCISRIVVSSALSVSSISSDALTSRLSATRRITLRDIPADTSFPLSDELSELPESLEFLLLSDFFELSEFPERSLPDFSVSDFSPLPALVFPDSLFSEVSGFEDSL